MAFALSHVMAAVVSAAVRVAWNEVTTPHPTTGTSAQPVTVEEYQVFLELRGGCSNTGPERVSGWRSLRPTPRGPFQSSRGVEGLTCSGSRSATRTEASTALARMYPIARFSRATYAFTA